MRSCTNVISGSLSLTYNGEDRSKERSQDKQNYPKTFTVKVDEDCDD